MEGMGIFAFLIIGAIAGWLAGKIMQGGGFGIIGNMAVGIVGAVIGGFIFKFVGITTGGWIGSIVTATIGAIVLLFFVGLIKKK